MIFEGAECRVEIRRARDAPSLLAKPRSFWESLAAMAGARIVSSFSTEACQAYILSQSSLFVFRHRVVMITCGSADLTGAAIVAMPDLCGSKLSLFAYSRTSGSGAGCGPARMEMDRLALTALLPGGYWLDIDPPEARPAAIFLAGPQAMEQPALGFELVMLDIAPGTGNAFHQADGPAAGESLARAGASDFLRGYATQGRAFDPAGYSLNAVLGEDYFSLHVTPEEGRSYVGVKSSRMAGAPALLEAMTRHFAPRSAMLFTSGASIPSVGRGLTETPLPPWARKAGLAFHIIRGNQ
jgi:S-adenosylmethionine decarboxylase